LTEFPGDYDYYLEKVGEMEREQNKSSLLQATWHAEMQEEEPRGSAAAGRRKGKEEKRREAEERQRKSERLFPLRERLAEIEEEIQGREARLQELMQMLAQPSLYKEGDKVREVIGEKDFLEDRIRGLYREWEEVHLRIEEISQVEG